MARQSKPRKAIARRNLIEWEVVVPPTRGSRTRRSGGDSYVLSLPDVPQFASDEEILNAAECALQRKREEVLRPYKRDLDIQIQRWNG